VYASLLELRMTGQRQPIAFTEDAFEDIYRIHIQTLESTRAAAPISMHKVLHQLFNDVTYVLSLYFGPPLMMYMIAPAPKLPRLPPEAPPPSLILLMYQSPISLTGFASLYT
jgi:hypothetical protein